MGTPGKPFDPSAYGAEPVSPAGAFDPNKYGAEPVGAPAATPPKANTPGFIDKAKAYLNSFVNEPLIPYFANKAKEAGQYEQNQLNQLYGPESEKEFKGVPSGLVPIIKAARHVATLPAAAARVGYGALGMTPEDATVLAASAVTGQPELAGGYFAAKGTVELPGQVKTAIQNPSPENVESALGTGATVAGGLAGMRPGSGAPSIEEAGSTLNKNQAQLNQVGKLRKVARNVTGVTPAIKDAVTKASDKFTDESAKADVKNQENAAAHAADVQRVAEENKAAEQTLGLRQKTEAELAGKTKDYFAAEDAAEKKSNAENQKNWDAWRQKTANTAVDMAPVKNVIEDVNAKFPEARAILNESIASPDELSAQNAQFVADRSAVMKQQGYGTDYDSLPADAKAKVDDLMDRLGLKPEGGVAVDLNKPMSLQDLHDWKTQLGWRLYRGEFPPNVTGAMKKVYSALQAAEARGSIEAGALPELEAARASHQQYQEAFGRSKPNRAFEGETRKKEANPEAYNEQQEQERLAAAGKVEPSLPSQYREVVGLREKVKALPSEEQLRKGLKQPPEPPEPVVPQEQSVDVQDVARKAIAERAKNWGHFNARDIGILSASIIAEPLIKLLTGHDAQGASNLLPVAAVAYEGGKYAASQALNNPKIIKWLSKPPAEEMRALSRIPGADKIKVQDGLTQIAIDGTKNGKPVRLSPDVESFLGPKNMAKIAAAGSGLKTSGELKKRAKELSSQ